MRDEQLRLLARASMLSIAASLTGLATPVHAQTQDGADQGSSLDEIIVTARRVEENQQKVPIAVSTLSAAALESRNVNAVNDIQFSVPNLQIKPGQVLPSQPEFIIRGQRQVLYTDENVVTYVNGVAQSTRGLTLYDLDSVQALKGPQGTLFGKNSMGGAMVFTTKRPIFNTEARVSVDVGNYNRKQANIMVNVPLVDDKVALRAVGQIERQDGFFKNLNPGQKDLNNRRNESGRISLLAKPTDRFENITTVDYIHRNEIPTPSLIEAAPLSGNFAGDITRQAVRQQSILGGSTAFQNTADNLLVRQGNPFRSVAQTGLGGRLGGSSAAAGFAAYSTYAALSEVYGLANTTSFEASDNITLKNILGLRYESATDYQDPAGLTGMTFDIGPTLGLPSGALSGPVTLFDTYTYNRYKTFSDEFQIIGKMENFNYIAGAYYSHRRHLYASQSSAIFGPVNIGATGAGPQYFERHGQLEDTDNAAAIFAQGTYDFNGIGLEGLRLTAGLRYTSQKKSMNITNFMTDTIDQIQYWNPSRPQAACNEINATFGNAIAVNNGTLCQMTNHRTYKALTWTASLEYQAAPETLLYLANRRGFKAGSPNQSSRLPEFSLFGSEQITDFELGMKHQGELGTVPFRLNVAGFIGLYRKIQTQDIMQFCSNSAADPSNAAACAAFTDLIVVNVGKATVKGVELEGTVKPIPQLQLDFGYSYQVGRYGRGSIVPQPANPALPVADSNPINFGGGTDLSGKEFAGVPRTTLTVAGTLRADFIPDSFARTSLSANYFYRSSAKGLSVQGIYRTPSFGTLGARLSFDELFGSDFSLAVWGANITNKHYKLYCADNINSIGYAACKWGDPRTYGITAQVKF